MREGGREVERCSHPLVYEQSWSGILSAAMTPTGFTGYIGVSLTVGHVNW